MKIDIQRIRQSNFQTLKSKGFVVAPSLPVWEENPVLRPIPEIAGRLAALNAYFVYVTAPADRFATDPLRNHLAQNKLIDHMTPDEQSAIAMSREDAAEQFGDSAGWRTENALSLAWILGSPNTPTIDGEMLNGDQIKAIVLTTAFGGPSEFAAWTRQLQPRSIEEVAACQDLFYCCHNAVRSAQVQMMQSRDRPPKKFETVPDGFDPMANGGVIHERRHALTWAISPGVAWDDTDLST